MSERIRSFIAVDIPDGLLAGIEPLIADLAGVGGDLKIVKTENLHFTIKFLGNIEEEMIGSIRGCMEEVSPLLGFDLKVGGLGAFPNARRPRVLWIGTRSQDDRMVKLARDLDQRLSNLGFAREKSYVPHLTLARARNRPGGQAISSFLARVGEVDLGTMRVDSVTLKRSVLTPRGPIYSDLCVVGPSGR